MPLTLLKAKSKTKYLLIIFAILFLGYVALFYRNNLFRSFAANSWSQTNWSGGTATGTVNGTVNTYESKTNIDTSTSGQISLEPIYAKYGILKGTQLSTGSTNLNASSLTAMKFNTSQTYNDSYFSYDSGSPTRLTVDQDGDYFLSYNLDILSDGISDSGNRSAISTEVYVNGVKKDVGIGASSYIRNFDNHFESNAGMAILLNGLSSGDYIEIYVVRSTTASHTLTGHLTLYAEKIDSSETIYAATGTRTISSTNLNGNASAIQWSADSRKDSGITHSTSSNSEQITIENTGTYMVSVNIPLYSTTQRANIKGKILLDGSTVSGGTFSQGYIRNQNGHVLASIHWNGLVTTTSPNQVLTVTAEKNSATGTVTVGGEKATIYIQKLPSEDIFYTSGTTLSDSSTNWNAPIKTTVAWTNDSIIDTNIYTHSTSSSSYQIAVDSGGDYLLGFNSPFIFSGSGDRFNPKVTVQVNGTDVTGATAKTSYIRNTSGHNEASNTMLVPIEGLADGDIITISTEQEADPATVTLSDPAILFLWRKGYPQTGNLISNIFDAQTGHDFGTLTYSTSGSGTVGIKIRSSNNSDMSGATDFSACSVIASGANISTGNCVTDNNRYIQYQVILSPSGSSTPVLEDLTINISPSDIIPPVTNASNILMYSSNGGSSIASTEWNNTAGPYFTWSAGADDVGGTGIRGYCLYLGTDSGADPSTTKGLLGTSPEDLGNSTCGFIVSTEYVDLSTSSYIQTTMTSSNSPYYLKIKAIDYGDNTYAGASAEFQFKQDVTAPTNVSYIACASGSFSNVEDMNFAWPTSGGSAASDDNSGLLGWQYQINTTTGTWLGTTTESTLGINYIPTTESSIELTAAQDGDSIALGNNIVYFRAVDNIGNPASNASVRTCNLSYGGDAPSFGGTDIVTITPSSATSNSFALSWPEANAAAGNSIAGYYYMVNTSPPTTYATLTNNASAYLPNGTSTTVTTTSLPNVNKGTNTIIVVAVDNENNYSPSNYIQGTFNLNSSDPDNIQNLIASDSSIKSEELWNVTLTWTAPDYQGAGNLNYLVYRGTDGSTFSQIGSTSGLSYVDSTPESTEYYYKIYSQDGANALSSGTNAITITPTGRWTEAPTLQSDPTVTNISTKRAQINWSTSRTADSKVQFGSRSGSYEKTEPSDSTQVTSHTIELSGLSPGTKYYYKVKWTDEDGNTGISKEYSFETESAPIIKEAVPKSIGISSVLLQFTAEGASKVKIYYGETASFGGVQEITTSTSESTYNALISDLSDGTKYYYKIAPFDIEGDEYENQINSFETLPRPKIENIRIQAVKGTAQPTMLVSWTTNTETSSIITYYPDNNPADARDEINVSLKTGEHKMLIKGLKTQTTYSLIVKGRDIIGNEAVGEINKFTTSTDTRPPLISDLKIEGGVVKSADGSQLSQLIVSWNTDEPATSQVEYGEGTGTNYSQKTQSDTNLTYNHLVVISGLQTSKAYHLRAISTDQTGNTVNSIDTVTITPKATDNALDLVITNLQEAFGFVNRLK